MDVDVLTRWRIRLARARLRRSVHPAAARIERALDEALRLVVAPDERPVIDRIESLRHTLSQCSTEIGKTDYGAGPKGARRTPEQMARGVASTTTVARACRASLSPGWSLFLFKLVRAFEVTTIVELGTCLGISAAYQASAQAAGRSGTLTTLEGDPALASLASDNLAALELPGVEVVPGRFQDTLAAVLARLPPVDLAFIDGHHDGDATRSYFEQFLSHGARDAILVFDDVSGRGMRHAWRAIATDGRVALSVNLGRLGLCVLGPGAES